MKTPSYKIRTFLLLLIICSIGKRVNATIAIDSIVTNNGVCVNDGSATVFAHTNGGAIYYEIIDGPITASLQNTAVFQGLLPGVYELKIVNDNNEEVSEFFVIDENNYNYPVFYYSVIDASCRTKKDGTITATRNTTTGSAPFSWEITDMQTMQTTTQTSNVFSNLYTGYYTISLIDGCGNSSSALTVFVGYPADNPYISDFDRPQIIGCYKTVLRSKLQTNTSIWQVRISTKNGTTYETKDLSINPFIEDTLNNIGYGDTVSYLFYNDCDSIPFFYEIPKFQMDFSMVGGQLNCNKYNNIGAFIGGVYFKDSFNFELRNMSGVLVASQYNLAYEFAIYNVSVPPDQYYFYTITDGCGNRFTDTIFWPTDTVIPSKTYMKYVSTLYSCLDSTANLIISPNETWLNPKIIFTSTPASTGSTKPNFAYTTVYTTGVLYNLNTWGPNYFTNLGVGIYHYQITDDCGLLINDSIIITNEMVNSFNYIINMQQGCQNTSMITISSEKNLTLYYKRYNILLVLKDASNNIIDTSYLSVFYGTQSAIFPYLSAGVYHLEINFVPKFPGDPAIYYPLATHACQSFVETITILPYQRLKIEKIEKQFCGGNNFVKINVEPNTGVPPLTYKAIYGNTIFPNQSSNEFVFANTGNYVIQIIDSCGTKTSFNITVDSLKYNTVLKLGSSCIGGKSILKMPPSSYVTYHWTTPSGSHAIGDTLLINPTTPNDLGVYTIQKLITTDSCSDTATIFYTLTPNIATHLYDTICAGDSVFFKHSFYKETGDYIDTFLRATCDSIVTLHLFTYYNYTIIDTEICAANSIAMGNKSYTKTGVYRDTIIENGCKTIYYLILKVLPYEKSTITQRICFGGSYFFHNRTLTETGIYRDTLMVNGCGFIDILYLIKEPMKTQTLSYNVCEGTFILINNKPYTNDTIIKDTLQDSDGCLIASHITIKKLFNQKDTVYKIICEGENYAFNNHFYESAGVYQDTIANTICKKIVTTFLSVNPKPIGNPSASSFIINYPDSITLQSCAVGSSYLWNTTLGCNVCPSISLQPRTAIMQLNCKVTNQYGCSIICENTIQTNGLYGDIYVPNAFSPNGDGVNDVFEAYENNCKIISLAIYNRWGELIFYSTDAAPAWNGSYKGVLQNNGEYVYQIVYIAGIETQAKSMKGSILLIR